MRPNYRPPRRSLRVSASLLLAVVFPVLSGEFCEFTVRRETNAAPSAVGSVRIWPFGVPETATLGVHTAAGRPVGHELLWRAPGEPWCVRFDASAGGDFVLRLTNGVAPAAPAWRPRAGLVLETRALAAGPVETLQQVEALWQLGGAPLGRSEVAQIFLGLHPHGPTSRFMSRFEGWLLAPRDGRYLFATLSDDASFLLVDDQPVAVWGGLHPVTEGLNGQYQGALELRAGPHRIVYHNVQDDSAFTVVAAWRPPGRKNLEVIPATNFAAVARYHIVRVAGAAGQQEAAFAWEVERQARVDDLAWMELRCRALAPEAATNRLYRWRFDDGGSAEGTAVRHLFTGMGLRAVTLEVLRDGAPLGSLEQRVAVHPLWAERTEFDEGVYTQMCATLRGRDWSRLPPADLAGAVLLAERIKDHALVADLAVVCRRRRAELQGPAATALYRLGFHYQEAAVKAYGQVGEVWRELLAAKTAPAPLQARTRLHLAGFLLHSGGDAAEAGRLLATLDEAALDDVDRRLARIYRADAEAVTGATDVARARYREVGEATSVAAPDYAVLRLARLERARQSLAQGYNETVEALLRELEWETPLSRMDYDTGMLLIAVHRARGEAPFALAACRRLLRVAPVAPRRADLLRVTAEVCAEQRLEAERQQVLTRLFAEFPYSEAAALARSRFGAPAGTAEGRRLSTGGGG